MQTEDRTVPPSAMLPGTRALVLGGTGLIGSQIVRSLAARGCGVRVVSRAGAQSPAPALRGLAVEVVRGDISDPDTIRGALEGIDFVFHAAAPYPTRHFGMGAVVQNAAAGMEALLRILKEAVAVSGLKRIVYTSSVTTIGRPRAGDSGQPRRTVSNEEDRYDLAPHPSPYFACKFQMEEAAVRAANEGLPLVIVNPTLVVDAGDAHLTTGKLLLEVARRRMPFYLPGMVDVIAGVDVGEGHVLAAMRGRTGQRYILGHKRMSLEAFLMMVAEEAGVRPPRIPCPYPAAAAISLATEGLARLQGREWPLFPMHGLRMLRDSPQVDSSLAVRELGLPQTSIRDAVWRALAWYRVEGLLR